VAGRIDPEHSALVTRPVAAIERGHSAEDSQGFGGELRASRFGADDATFVRPLQQHRNLPMTQLPMLLFAAIALSILWVAGTVLGLALGAMLARADGRRPQPARPDRARARTLRHELDRLAPADRVLPTA
jgi:hypothetical protein